MSECTCVATVVTVLLCCPVARIGFENIIFSVEEGSGSGAGFAEIPVAVLGTITLGGEVTVRFSTSDLSAIGQCNVI